MSIALHVADLCCGGDQYGSSNPVDGTAIKCCNVLGAAVSNRQVMEMVKLRDARYCNLKLLLIFLVIYGHLIEPGVWQSPALMTQYRWIYLFHMPLFSFLSGLFLNSREACGRQLGRMLSVYIPLQAVAVLLGKGEVKPLTPFWHLWYLLSCSTWTGLGWLWFRLGRGKGKLVILVCSVLAGCAAGLVPSIGREHSLSRTMVFLPYFWLGLICDPGFPWERLRPLSAGLLGIVVVMVNWGGGIPVTFLYQAEPYGTIENGALLRFACYLIGTALGLFLLSVTPTKRFPFTRAGGDTMPAYLIHAPIVLCIRELDVPWPFHLLNAALILYAVYKLRRWRGRLYGIVPTERRDGRCRIFRKSTKNMPSRSTGSCCP